MGAPIQMNRFIPNLARLCAPLRPLLCKTKEWKWADQHDNTFQTIRKEIQKITEIKYFKRTQHLKNARDASRDDLGAVLQQQTEQEWRATHSASSFLTSFELKYLADVRPMFVL